MNETLTPKITSQKRGISSFIKDIDGNIVGGHCRISNTWFAANNEGNFDFKPKTASKLSNGFRAAHIINFERKKEKDKLYKQARDLYRAERRKPKTERFGDECSSKIQQLLDSEEQIDWKKGFESKEALVAHLTEIGVEIVQP